MYWEVLKERLFINKPERSFWEVIKKGLILINQEDLVKGYVKRRFSVDKPNRLTRRFNINEPNKCTGRF